MKFLHAILKSFDAITQGVEDEKFNIYIFIKWIFDSSCWITERGGESVIA
jgi:hypothetical protein